MSRAPLALTRLATLVLASFALACGSSGDGGGDPPTHGGSANVTGRFRDYLRASPYPKLVLELDVVPGAEPYQQSTADLVTALRTILAKPGGINVSVHESIPSRGADHAWTFPELQALADATFNLEVPGDTTKMHMIFVDGHSAEDDATGSILGLAWSHTHLVMFTKTIRTLCGNHPSRNRREKLCAATERGVWVHEVGHLLGLVDNGLPMVSNHRDPDTAHGRHDANEDCIMYWSYDGAGIVNKVARRLEAGDESAIGFDSACLADLAAVRDSP